MQDRRHLIRVFTQPPNIFELHLLVLSKVLLIWEKTKMSWLLKMSEPVQRALYFGQTVILCPVGHELFSLHHISFITDVLMNHTSEVVSSNRISLASPFINFPESSSMTNCTRETNFGVLILPGRRQCHFLCEMVATLPLAASNSLRILLKNDRASFNNAAISESVCFAAKETITAYLFIS